VTTSTETRGRDRLASTRAVSAYQREFVANLRKRVVEDGQQYAFVSGAVPHEILRALDIPYMVDVWWSGLVAAKRMSAYYLDFLERQGFHNDLPKYAAVALATLLDQDHPDPPWGGLPKPAFVVGRANTAGSERIFDLLAKHLDVPLAMLEVPGSTHMYPNWWEISRWQWEDLYESHRIDFMVEQFRDMLDMIHSVTGRRLDIDRLREVIERVNQQGAYLDEVREMVCAASKCPVSVTDQMNNAMATQWHRGSDWALEHARIFRDEVAARVRDGVAVCEHERLRLMWVGFGLWQDTDFYQAFEDDYGAVFVRSMYLDLAADSYVRHGLTDPLRALASRYTSISEELHNAPWCSEWAVSQAKRYRVDGAIVTLGEGRQGSVGGSSLFTMRALEAAGIPTLGIDADPVDSRSLGPEELRANVSQFIEHRLAASAQGRQS
jgi:benzoyl-CoA reductase subunit B